MLQSPGKTAGTRSAAIAEETDPVRPAARVPAGAGTDRNLEAFAALLEREL
ncbi:hypothetical protein ABZT03_29215 [Streptomyces sp. NPDC005574]|uniref:hypothetical protein n=1 Tax=Streptomyces sp. NPDC005574 TaxID=3156891 RepID=UPI0033A5AE6B